MTQAILQDVQFGSELGEAPDGTEHPRDLFAWDHTGGEVGVQGLQADGVLIFIKINPLEGDLVLGFEADDAPHEYGL